MHKILIKNQSDITLNKLKGTKPIPKVKAPIDKDFIFSFLTISFIHVLPSMRTL